MSSSTTSVAAVTPTQHPFERKVDEIKPSKKDINFVIMDYLIREGYPRAAEKFAKEANIQLPYEYELIQERVAIRSAIHAGDIETAITKINNLSPQILDSDPALHFDLLRLQLIELIRTCTSSPGADIQPVLNFAASQLAPRAINSIRFRSDLEATMCLLIFLPSDEIKPDFERLLKPEIRRKIAGDVNEAILSSMGTRGEARIRGLVRLRHWAETRARKSGKDLPPSLPLGLRNDATSQHANGTGDTADAMIQ